MSNKTPSGPHSLPASPPEAWEPFIKLARIAGGPLERFLRIEAASGILLLIFAAIGLLWANSPWSQTYHSLWRTSLGFQLGSLRFERPLDWYVNDGLMVIFFFVVGLEIRRELHHGELSEWRRAALPAAAALGGMLVPAGLYLAIAGAPISRSGWGVPMATDIAFAVGILALLGKRVPPSLRVLLLALAVIDDLGAIMVIAIFYSSGVSILGLAIAAAGLMGLLVMQRFGIRAKLAYVLPGVIAWAGIYNAGIHPTIAGVIVGLMTPVRAWLGPDGFIVDVRAQLERLALSNPSAVTSHELAGMLREVDAAGREAMSPAESLIERLHPWVAFGVMPLFAFANAGVSLAGESLSETSILVATGVAVGLMLGKPLGVLVATWLTLRLGIGSLPAGMTVRHILVLGVVAGVGFTMALFVAQLAFTDVQLLAAAKLGVLGASGGAAVLALLLGRLLLAPAEVAGAAQTADEAESSTEI